VRNNVLQTAAFARRVVCRTLTVVGGVAAGTALAWWLSSATASADIVPPAGDQTAAVAEFTVPVEPTADTVVRYLQDPPPPPKDPLAELGQTVEDTAKQFRDHAEQHIPQLADCAATTCLGGSEQRVYHPDALGRSAFPVAPVSAPVASILTPVVAVDASTPNTAKDRAFADGMSRRGSPAPVQPALPDLPDWPAPWSPVPVSFPTTGNQSSAGNTADSHLFAALPWQDSTTELVAGGVTPTTAAAVFGRPGNQPGVAPD
jgi:hypothetical protein